MPEIDSTAATIDTVRTIAQDTLERNHDILGMEVNGLSHADSLLQPQPRGNCLNWVVGHMAANRDIMLQALGAPTVFAAGTLDHYQRGSAPILADEEGVQPLEDLVAGFATQGERLQASLAAATDAELASPSLLDGMNVVESVQFLAWHESYHMGQTSLLRQLSGVNDTVIP
ncbi:MAG: DinB family protein [Thermomicrobiales bacterium]